MRVVKVVIKCLDRGFRAKMTKPVRPDGSIEIELSRRGDCVDEGMPVRRTAEITAVGKLGRRYMATADRDLLNRCTWTR